MHSTQIKLRFNMNHSFLLANYFDDLSSITFFPKVYFVPDINFTLWGYLQLHSSNLNRKIWIKANAGQLGIKYKTFKSSLHIKSWWFFPHFWSCFLLPLLTIHLSPKDLLHLLQYYSHEAKCFSIWQLLMRGSSKHLTPKQIIKVCLISPRNFNN